MTALCIPYSAHPCPCVGPVAGLILIDPFPVKHYPEKPLRGKTESHPMSFRGTGHLQALWKGQTRR